MENTSENECNFASDGDENVFQFETEHLALRGNQDYIKLLRAIAKLHAQRILVHQHIDELHQKRHMFMNHPELLIEKIRNNEPIIAPNYITIINLPELATTNDADSTQIGITTPSTVPTQLSQKPAENNGVVARTQHTKILWTNEEQRRLEQLLIEYPPEEVEMRRFSKIAKALGNRTPQQVFSRVQKYFQKLHDAGMPVPGRIPKHRRAGANKTKYKIIRRSTFFPAQNISIQMPEDDYILDDLPSTSSTPPPPIIKSEVKSEPQSSVNDDVAEAERRKQLKINLLTSIRDEKLDNPHGYFFDPLAPRCVECEQAAVMQTRWRCNSCYCFLNFCGDCLASHLIENTFEHLAHDVVVEDDT